MVRELSHYIDGQQVEGTSGRFGDVFDPCTGEVQARVPLASREEVHNAVASAEKAPGRMGGHEPAAPGEDPAQVRGPGQPEPGRARHGCCPPSTARPSPTRRATSSAASRWWSSPPAPRTCSRASSPTDAGTGDRHPLAAPAPGRGRRHYPVQLSRHDPAVEVRPGAGRGQRVHPQALRTGPLRAAAAGRTVHRSGRAGRGVQRGQRRQGSRGRAARGSAGQGHRVRGLHPDRPVHLRHRRRPRQARPVLRRGQEPHGDHAGRGPGHGRGRPDRRRATAPPANAAWPSPWPCRWARKPPTRWLPS